MNKLTNTNADKGMESIPSALVIDTETDQGKNPRPIQVATINVATGHEWMAYFNSGRSISPIVTKVHGITDKDVAHCPPFDLAKLDVGDYLIGHNVRFDWRVIGKPNVKLICTVRLARLAFPEWDRYGQSRCIEQLIGIDAAQEMTAEAHDALGDARMCYLLYTSCCEHLQIDPLDLVQVHELVNSAKPLSRMPFGKYKGKRIDEVPIGYIKWMLAKIHNLQPSLRVALRNRLDKESDNIQSTNQ